MKDRIRIIEGETYLMLDESEAAQLHGKYREDRPFWRVFGDRIGVLVDAQLQKWRETSGKRLCQNKDLDCEQG